MKSQAAQEEKESAGADNNSFDRTRRDTFLLRFRPGSDFLDKVITESNLFSEMSKQANDIFWKELTSISLTPMVKVGLGKLFTFEFVAPCFERERPKWGEDPTKNDSMSFYGEVRYDFR